MCALYKLHPEEDKFEQCFKSTAATLVDCFLQFPISLFIEIYTKTQSMFGSETSLNMKLVVMVLRSTT